MSIIQRSQAVMPGTHEVFKFFPNNPPVRGDIVLVDGVRCRVVRSKIRWDDQPEPDGRRRWTILKLRVRLADA
jgi:hypothetical protein